MTIRGPAPGMEDAFYRQNSPFYNDTVVGIVSSNYPGVSNLREFQNINGLFDSPAILGTNDKQTGTGVIRSVLLNYSPEAFPSIFSEAGPVVQSAGQAAFATYFNGRPFKIVVSRPDDQDFDLATLLRDYNEVMELDLVIPTSGMEEEFFKLRQEFAARARNIPGTRVFTFKPIFTPPEAVTQWPGTAEELELLITVYRLNHKENMIIFNIYKRHWQLIRSKLGFYFSSGITLDMYVFFLRRTSY